MYRITFTKRGPVQAAACSLGSGYWGQRDDGYNNFVAGFIAFQPPPEGEGETAESRPPRQVNIPSWDNFYLTINRNGRNDEYDLRDLHENQTLSDITTIDMRKGMSIREIELVEDGNPTGTKLTVILEKLFSRDHPQTAAVRLSVQSEREEEIRVRTGIDGDARNQNEKFLREEDKGKVEGTNGVYYEAKSYLPYTDYKGNDLHITLSQKIDISQDDKSVHLNPVPIEESEKIFQEVLIKAQSGKTHSFGKIVAVATSQDKAIREGKINNSLTASKKELTSVGDFEALKEEQIAAWQRIWDTIGLYMEADQEDVQAMLFNIWHQMQVFWDGDEMTAPTPKGFGHRANEGYEGNTFWDADIDQFPFALFLFPAIAIKMVEYRKVTGQAAHAFALETLPTDSDYEKENRGWQYHWESALGEKGGPEFVFVESGAIDALGNKIKEIEVISSQRKELHITADVAFAAWQLWQGTRDERLLRNLVAPIVIETAKFWAHRAEYDETTQTYDYSDVVPPNEYWKLGVKGNGFTNFMALENLMRAVEIYEKFKDDPNKPFNLPEKEIELIKDVIAKLRRPFDVNTLIVSPREDYDSLIHEDLAQFHGKRHVDVLLKEKYANKNAPQYTDTHKQQDSVFLLMLLGKRLLDLLSSEAKEEVIQRYGDADAALAAIFSANQEKFRPVMCFGSTLAFAAEAEAKLLQGKDPNKVYREEFRYALHLETKNLAGDLIYGPHVAAEAAVWRVLFSGFAGISLDDNGISVDPHYPDEEMGRLALKFRYRYQELVAEYDPETDTGTISAPDLPPGVSIPVTIKGKLVYLTEKNRSISYPLS